MSDEKVADAGVQPVVEEKMDTEPVAETAVDEHLKEHEGATKFFVVFNKKIIPFYFNLVCFSFSFSLCLV